MDLSIPEVPGFSQAARFFRDERGRDMVEISFVGDKTTLIHKVKPEHMAQFKEAWDAYCDGIPPQRRAGTPLTECPGINEQLAEAYVQKNLHTLEELAALSDAQCQGLGHGTLTFRHKARQLVLQRQADRDAKGRQEIATKQASVGAAVEVNELAAVKAIVAEQGAKIDALVAALTKQLQQPEPPKRGRPRKDKNGSLDTA